MSWFEGLTERQRKFCEAYSANGGNQTKAAEFAGYANPEPRAAELVRNSKIINALEMLRCATTAASIATREERQSFWTQAMRDEARELKDRLKASELLGKSQADFIDRKEITGKDGSPLVAEVRITFVGADD